MHAEMLQRKSSGCRIVISWAAIFTLRCTKSIKLLTMNTATVIQALKTPRAVLACAVWALLLGFAHAQDLVPLRDAATQANPSEPVLDGSAPYAVEEFDDDSPPLANPPPPSVISGTQAAAATDLVAPGRLGAAAAVSEPHLALGSAGDDSVWPADTRQRERYRPRAAAGRERLAQPAFLDYRVQRRDRWRGIDSGPS